MFTMADDERVESMLASAGFTDVLIEDVPVSMDYADVEEYVAASRDTGGAFARAFSEASEEERQAITKELAEAFTPFEVDGGLALPGVALVALAR
jgi:hypothetical protein